MMKYLCSPVLFFAFNFIVFTGKAATLSSPPPPPICSGTVFSYVPTSSTSGVTFTWTRAAVAGISNPPSSGAGSVLEVLSNITALPITVTYAYTLFDGVTTNTENVAVLVNPMPLLASATSPGAICSGTLFSYVPTSLTLGTTFLWSRVVVTGISNPASSGSMPVSEVLNNTTLAPVVAVYVYTLSANGCTNSENVSVTVEPTPPSISGTTNVCAGGTAALANSLTGGTWASGSTGVATIGSGSGIVTAIAGGTSVITYTTAAGCTRTIVFTVGAIPSAGTISGASSVCIGASAGFSNTVSGGTWATYSGAAAISVSGTVLGIFAGADTVIYTVINACGTKRSKKPVSVVACPAGIGSASASNGFTIYPNPAISKQVTINSRVAGELTVSSINGSVLKKHIISENECTIQLPATLAAGIYFCRFTGCDGTSVLTKLLYQP